MKLKIDYEINKHPNGKYRIIAVCGNFYVNRLKDVHNYYKSLEQQSNLYLKDLLKIHSELTIEMSLNISTIKSLKLKEYIKENNQFFERLNYLRFYDYVEQLFKMNALYSMNEHLMNCCIALDRKDLLKRLDTNKTTFFISRKYWTKQENTMKIKEPTININSKKPLKKCS